MLQLTLGLALFLGVHSVAIVAPRWRERAVLRMGPAAWRMLYAVLSAAGLLLVVIGFPPARAAAPIWYAPAHWMRDVARVLMFPVFPLLLAAYLPGRIKAMAKHPMLAAVKLWAFAHLLANGSAADVLLFGSFLAWAVFDRISLKHRAAPRATPGAPPSRWNDAIAVVAGVLVYVAMLKWAHLRLFGVAPLA
jgi:uncharacterized membrane protein